MMNFNIWNFLLAMFLAATIKPAFRVLGWFIHTAYLEIRDGDRKELNEFLLVAGCGMLVAGTLMAPYFLGIKI